MNTNFTTPFVDDQVKSVALQDDGKIVAAGYTAPSENGSSALKFALARYNIDGSLDPTFNGTGKVTTTVGRHPEGGTPGARASSVAVQPDGKILAAGTASNNFTVSVALVRYNSDGSLDTSFNDTGIVLTMIGAEFSSAMAMALQPDGRIVLAGTSDSNFLVARYYGNGTLEGSVTTDFATELGAPADEAHAVALQSDGKILVAGKAGLVAGPSQ